jgi:hypothetical protein
VLRERFVQVRKDLVAIDDKLYNSTADFERETQDSQTARAVAGVSDALRAVISILLRVIDSLP